jgi:hypothetical protein
MQGEEAAEPDAFARIIGNPPPLTPHARA